MRRKREKRPENGGAEGEREREARGATPDGREQGVRSSRARGRGVKRAAGGGGKGEGGDAGREGAQSRREQRRGAWPEERGQKAGRRKKPGQRPGEVQGK